MSFCKESDGATDSADFIIITENCKTYKAILTIKDQQLECDQHT